jgi:hypothetical protein
MEQPDSVSVASVSAAGSSARRAGSARASGGRAAAAGARRAHAAGSRHRRAAGRAGAARFPKGAINREDRLPVPAEALREIVINAVIHRDVSNPSSYVAIAVFDDPHRDP